MRWTPLPGRRGKPSREVTLLQSAIPHTRGIATHVERDDGEAYTEFDGRTGLVKEVHTPAGILQRVHETMHARHTNTRAYRGIRPEVADFVEDCRLHRLHWPWPGGRTPKIFVDAAVETFAAEASAIKEMAKEGAIEPFVTFSQRMRENAVMLHLTGAHKGQTKSAYDGLEMTVHGLINQGKHELAAWMIEEAFFGDEKKKQKQEAGEDECEGDGDAEKSEDGDGKKRRGHGEADGVNLDELSDDEAEALDKERRKMAGIDSVHRMDIIELPLTEDTNLEVTGHRHTTMGPRIWRPALRRPVLPQRLFVKRSPSVPGGALLFDASGSMGVSREVLYECCRRAPAATVAFYSGEDGGTQGVLYVYARDGRRASKSPKELRHYGGNGVDGFALDWLMKQEGPRMFVTDRQFTGRDAMMQGVRLARLESTNEVEVFANYSTFMTKFPKLEL